MQELDHYINTVEQLPPAPKVLAELLGLLSKPNVDSDRIIKLITYDPSLTAGVLQLCNSAYIGLATPASDLMEALTRLGFTQVFQLVAAISVSKVLGTSQPGYGIDEGELWLHSVTTAVAAEVIAKRLGDDPSLPFTAALLHDIGKIVLTQAVEKVYTKILDDVEHNQQSLLDAEKKHLGVQHAEIGGRLLARWRFPANLVSAVWFHHNPKAAEPHHRLASYVYVANMIAYFMGNGFGHQAFAFRGRTEAFEYLQLKPESVPELMMETFERLDVVEAFFSLR